MTAEKLVTPYVWVDLNIMEQNIRQMIVQLNKNGIDHRPHVKTHKSLEIARYQIEQGAIGITCSKLSEALVMAKGGINNILIAYPLIGAGKSEMLIELMSLAHVTVIVDSFEGVELLRLTAKKLKQKIPVLIDVMTDLKRTGVKTENLVVFAQKLLQHKNLQLEGIFSYGGAIKTTGTSKEGIQEFSYHEKKHLIYAKELLEKNSIAIKMLSSGSTVTSCIPECLTGITESRAGNYLFGDKHYTDIGVVRQEHCSLFVHVTIVSIPEPGFAIIDAGSKILSAETYGLGYGYVCLYPEIQIYKINEEHGYIKYNPQTYRLKIGQILDIIPNHSCAVANLCDYIFGFRDGLYDHKIKIDARGKSY